MPPWEHIWALRLMSLRSGALFHFKECIYMMVFFSFNCIPLTRVQFLSFSWAHIFFLVASTNSNLSGWMVDSLKVKVSFPSSMFDTMGVLQLGIFSGDDLALSSWWSRLYEKLAVSGRLGLVLDKATDAKREMRPNTLGVSFPFLSLSWKKNLILSPEIQRFFVFYD